MSKIIQYLKSIAVNVALAGEKLKAIDRLEEDVERLERELTRLDATIEELSRVVLHLHDG